MVPLDGWVPKGTAYVGTPNGPAGVGVGAVSGARESGGSDARWVPSGSVCPKAPADSGATGGDGTLPAPAVPGCPPLAGKFRRNSSWPRSVVAWGSAAVALGGTTLGAKPG